MHEEKSKSGKLGVGRWGLAILGTVVTAGFAERPVCQLHQLEPAAWGEAISLSKSH